MTTEQSALDLAAHTLSVLFCERTVKTFWQKPTESNNKCLHKKV